MAYTQEPWMSEATWQAGLASVDITPTEPMWLSGYAGRTRPSEGTLHPLWAKALALKDASGTQAILVTTDLLGFSRAMWLSLCQSIQERHGLPAAQVMLSYTHNHSSPVLWDSLPDYYELDEEQLACVERYSTWVEGQILACVAAALTDQRPAHLSAGEGQTTFAVNRRNNREVEVPERQARGEALNGPVDHTVPVLQVRDPAGSLRAVVFGYACHTTTLSDYQWCGDYAGYAQLAVEAAHPGAMALFWTGCGGDQNPLPRRTVELCEKYGTQLAAGVEVGLNGPQRPLAPMLAAALETVPLEYEHTPTREELQAATEGTGVRPRWARRMLRALEAGSLSTEYPYTVQAWRLGSQLWIALAGEAVVDYALRFKHEYGAETWVNGYAHDMVAYMPSRRVWEEGGYEGGTLYEYALPAERWAGDVEERIAAGVARAVQATGLSNA